jgi:hypothetical protein
MPPNSDPLDPFVPLVPPVRSGGRLRSDPTSEGELIRLRNRITALEANGSELLARAEQAEAERDALQALAATSPSKGAEVWDLIATVKERDERVNAAIQVVMDHIKNAFRAPESNADAPSPVSAATEAHGETTEAQEGSR